MSFARRLLIASLAVMLAGAPMLSEAQGRPGRGGGPGGGWGPGWGWGAVVLGLDLALLANYEYNNTPRVVYTQPVVVVQQPAASTATSTAAVSSASYEPIIYPRNGQSAEQIESDRQACNSWASTQPKAQADASVFKRATEACMDGRGYTLR